MAGRLILPRAAGGSLGCRMFTIGAFETYTINSYKDRVYQDAHFAHLLFREGAIWLTSLLSDAAVLARSLQRCFLQNDGNVCVVDRNAEAFSNLSRNFNGTTLQGLGFDEDVLIRAGVEEADVVAAVTQSDNSNLMVVEVARRIFHVPACYRPPVQSRARTRVYAARS